METSKGSERTEAEGVIKGACDEDKELINEVMKMY